MKFKKGQSGNPAGRPKGAKDRNILFKAIVDPHREDLLGKAIEMALNGDQQMLRVLLDRILPAKPKDDSISTSFVVEGTMSDQARNIIKMVSQRQLTPAEANGLLKAMNQQVGLIEYDEVDRRISSLEAKFS